MPIKLNEVKIVYIALTVMLCCNRLKAELEKLRPEREKPMKKRASSPYTIYVQENFNSHRQNGMPTKDVRTRLLQ